MAKNSMSRGGSLIEKSGQSRGGSIRKEGPGSLKEKNQLCPPHSMVLHIKLRPQLIQV